MLVLKMGSEVGIDVGFEDGSLAGSEVGIDVGVEDGSVG
jgi:hypothetical protein